MPPKMLKKIDRTWCVVDDLERVDDALRVRPPRSQKLAGLPPANVTTSTVDIEARAVPEDADLAVELHVRHALLARECLERVGSGNVAHLGDVRAGTVRCRRP